MPYDEATLSKMSPGDVVREMKKNRDNIKRMADVVNKISLDQAVLRGRLRGSIKDGERRCVVLERHATVPTLVEIERDGDAVEVKFYGLVEPDALSWLPDDGPADEDGDGDGDGEAILAERDLVLQNGSRRLEPRDELAPA